MSFSEAFATVHALNARSWQVQGVSAALQAAASQASRLPPLHDLERLERWLICSFSSSSLLVEDSGVSSPHAARISHACYRLRA